MSDSGLEITLETRLPASIPVGRATAVFIYGTCFHRDRRVESIDLIVRGNATTVAALRMPRLDLFRSLHPMLSEDDEATIETDPASVEDPGVHSFRSAFWATVPVPALDYEGPIPVEISAGLEGGTTVSAELGAINVVATDQPMPLPAGVAEGGRPPIAICMATFEPKIELFRVQIDSIREQSDTDWVCVISDDCSSPDRHRQMLDVVDGDPRFIVSRSERRLGFYRNFERALEIAPAETELIALCDQDDRWYPEKLGVLREGIGDARLVYSDQRIVDTDGRVIADTYWTERRNNHDDLASLLVANTVTGAASMFTREVLVRSLPFPVTPGEQFHDQWLALVALSIGRIAYVDRPLYDYVQHHRAALGHEAANRASEAASPLKRRGLLDPRAWKAFVSGWRSAYFYGYRRVDLLASVLLARCSDRLGMRDRRMLHRIARAEHSPLAFGWLALRPLRRLLGHTETLGNEKILVEGILWRHLIATRSRRTERPYGSVYDASLPPEPSRTASFVGEKGTADLQRMIAPFEISVSESEPERINLLIPTIDLRHLFGGYIAKYNLARKLVESGLRVRIVAVDANPILPRTWRDQVQSYAGLEQGLESVEVAFARGADQPLTISPRDRFVATTWWTAHHAERGRALTERDRFLYLIQEYEPYTFVMGSWAALAGKPYDFPHHALFSTELLRSFFKERGFGVFSPGGQQSGRQSISFQNAITPVTPPTEAELAERTTRRLLFYARPEPHAARNMFELGMISIASAIEQGVFGPEWEFYGIGSVGGRNRVRLTGSTDLELLTRKSQSTYGDLLGSHDVGLSLMLTPHPSLVPIEMASAGMLTVTNSFDIKTPEAMAAISPNLITVTPGPDDIAEGLRTAVDRVGDHRSRVEGSAVNWSSDWERTFSPEVTARILAMLEDC